MKAGLYIGLLVTTILFSSCEFGSNSQVEVISAALQFSQDTSIDINAPGISPSYIKASIKGKIMNKGEKSVKNVIITYKFPRGQVTAKVSSLKPGQTAEFTTNTYNSKNKTPDYKLESVTYDLVE